MNMDLIADRTKFVATPKQDKWADPFYTFARIGFRVKKSGVNISSNRVSSKPVESKKTWRDYLKRMIPSFLKAKNHSRRRV